MQRKIKNLLAALHNNSFLPVFLVIVAIQGTVVASQFFVTLLLTPNEIGVIRSIETAVGLLIVFVGCGSQTLLVRDVALEKSKHAQRTFLLQGIIVIGIGITALALILTALNYLTESKIIGFVVDCIILIGLSNMVRLLIAFSHGSKKVKHVYITTIIFSAISVLIILSTSKFYGVVGWIVGRHLAEGLMLVGVILSILRTEGWNYHMPFDSWSAVMRFISRGFKSNASLVLRMTADALPIILVNLFRAPTQEIAQIGMAILGAQLVMLPLAVMAQHALPRIVSVDSGISDSLAQNFYRKILHVGVLGAALFGVASLIGWQLINGDYKLAYICALILSLTFPLKAISLAFGTLFLVRDNFLITLKINLIEIFVLIFASHFLYKYFGVIGVSVSIVFGALFTSLLLWMAYERC